MLATVFKHLEFVKSNAADGQPHPATHLLQTAYPTLDALLQQEVHQDMCRHVLSLLLRMIIPAYAGVSSEG